MQSCGRQAGQRLVSLRLAVTALFLVLSTLAVSAEPRFPKLTGRVVDEASLLTPADVAQLTADLEALEKKSSDQLVVVTLKSLQGYAIEDFGYQLGRAWQIGQTSVNNGVLLIVAPTEHKVRIEVGRGLEPQLTDAMSSLIIQNAILPAFRRGDWAGGIKAGARDIADVLLGDQEAVNQRLSSVKKRSPETDWSGLLVLLFWATVIAIVLYSHYQQSRRMAATRTGQRPRGGYGANNPIIIPGGWGGSGGWSGSGGGGFSGGGGDFGGGGSSGSW
jgi:uncharacterized protein